MPTALLITSATSAMVVIAAAFSLRRLRIELSLLRVALRQAGAIDVASNELDREATAIGARAAFTHADAKSRLRPTRSRHDRGSR